MTTSLRLPEYLSRRLDTASKLEKRSKSDVLKEALVLYLAHKTDDSPWALGKDLFGRSKSGRSDLSEKHKEIWREKLREKHSH